MRLSPESRRLALTIQESGIASIAVYDVKTTEMTRVTARPGEYTGLTWMRGDNLAFGGATGLGWVRSTAAADSARLMSVNAVQTPWSISPDGQRIAYYERGPETGFDLWTVPIVGADKDPSLGLPEPFLRTRAFEVYPSFSPDGRWITYASNESGTWEIYARRFPDDGTKVRVSTSGGVVPYWSANGYELMYRTDANKVMVVSYKVVGESFTVSAARPWSPHTLADTGVLPNFTVDTSGERILALMSAPPGNPQSPNHVTIILNLAEVVRRRAASR
jgi:serine/threonine-protein kinase